jgi:hypothetical protein
MTQLFRRWGIGVPRLDEVRSWHRRAVLNPFRDWAGFGVRDPSVLVSEAGEFVYGRDGYVMFFNARDRPLSEGGATVVGRATSPDGEQWTPHPDPVLVDGMYAAQGSAVALESGEIVMPYSPDTLAGFRLAFAPNPYTVFEPDGGLILTPDDVGCHRIGLPFIWREGGDWRLVFEAIRPGGRFVILGAESSDLRSWTVDPRPRLGPPDGAWDGYGQANPSVHSMNGRRLMLYNGSSKVAQWDVGVATERNGQWHGSSKPVLARTRHESWSAQRLEGARPGPNSGRRPELLYFGTPGRDSYEGATIGLATASGLRLLQTSSLFRAPINESPAGMQSGRNPNAKFRIHD